MALPLYQLWGLQINRKQKAGLAGMFCLGLIVILVAIVRFIQTNATTQHVDPVWLALWSMIEASVGKSSYLDDVFL